MEVTNVEQPFRVLQRETPVALSDRGFAFSGAYPPQTTVRRYSRVDCAGAMEPVSYTVLQINLEDGTGRSS